MTTPPAAPFERLQIYEESLPIDTTGKYLVLPIENTDLLQSFNEWTLSPNRCNLTETPCGGFKNSAIPDYHPYSISVDGAGALLSIPSGAFSGIALGAGKLAETGYINNYTSAIEYRTADGETYATADGNQ